MRSPCKLTHDTSKHSNCYLSLLASFVWNQNLWSLCWHEWNSPRSEATLTMHNTKEQPNHKTGIALDTVWMKPCSGSTPCMPTQCTPSRLIDACGIMSIALFQWPSSLLHPWSWRLRPTLYSWESALTRGGPQNLIEGSAHSHSHTHPLSLGDLVAERKRCRH